MQNKNITLKRIIWADINYEKLWSCEEKKEKQIGILWNLCIDLYILWKYERFNDNERFIQVLKNQNILEIYHALLHQDEAITKFI